MSSAPETKSWRVCGRKAIRRWQRETCSYSALILLCAPGLIQSLLPIGDFLPGIRNLAVIAGKEGHVLRKRRSYAAINCCAEWSQVKLQRKWSRKRRLSGLSQALFNASRIVLVSYGSTYSACSAK